MSLGQTTGWETAGGGKGCREPAEHFLSVCVNPQTCPPKLQQAEKTGSLPALMMSRVLLKPPAVRGRREPFPSWKANYVTCKIQALRKKKKKKSIKIKYLPAREKVVKEEETVEFQALCFTKCRYEP